MKNDEETQYFPTDLYICHWNENTCKIYDGHKVTEINDIEEQSRVKGATEHNAIAALILSHHHHLYWLKRCNTTYSASGHNVSRTARLWTRRTHSRPRKRIIIKNIYKNIHKTYTHFKYPLKSTTLIVRLKADKLSKLTSVVVKTFFRSRDQDRYLGHQASRPRPRPGQNEPESRDHGLEITSLAASIPIGDRALA